MLASPRLRRRLLRLALVGAVVGGAVASFVIWPNTADRAKYESPLSNEPAFVAVPAQPVPLTGKSRDAALETARRFLGTAVARKHVEDSWALVHPLLRQGMTRQEWSTGEIPVTPYPVDSARWRLGYSQADAVGLEVYLFPTAGSRVREMVFDLELRPVGSGAARRWLVSSWAPRGGGLNTEPPRSPEREAAEVAARERSDALRLPAAWLLIPVGLFAAVLLLPLALRLRERRRNALAERAAREHREARQAARDSST